MAGCGPISGAVGMVGGVGSGPVGACGTGGAVGIAGGVGISTARAHEAGEEPTTRRHSKRAILFCIDLVMTFFIRI